MTIIFKEAGNLDLYTDQVANLQPLVTEEIGPHRPCRSWSGFRSLSQSNGNSSKYGSD